MNCRKIPLGYNTQAVAGVKFIKMVIVTGAAMAALIILSACGGMTQGLTVGGAASIQPGGSIGPTEELRIAFLQQPDLSTLPGSITVSVGYLPVPFHYALTDGGYTLVISPVTEWPGGETITVTLAGG